MRIKKSISRTLLFYMVIAAVIPMIFAGYFTIFQTYKNFYKQSKEIKETYLTNQKQILRSEVEHIIFYINHLMREHKTLENNQDNAIHDLASLRFGEKGYFFGSTFQGDPLFSNGKITKGKDSVWNLTDPNGVKLIQLQRETAKNPEGGFYEYYWPKLDDDKLYPKLSFTLSIPEWEWMIGAGIYIDEIDEMMAKRKALLNKQVNADILTIVFIFILLVILITSIARYFSNAINKSFKTFTTFFDKSNIDSTSIKLKDFHFPEFISLAVSTNKMIELRKQTEIESEKKSKELEKHFAKSEKQRIATLSLLADLNETSKSLKKEVFYHKLAEEDLIISKRTADRYLNVVAEIIISLDLQGNITMLNDSGHKSLGYEKGELIGKNWHKTCLPKDINSDIEVVFSKLIETESEVFETYENNIITKTGEIKTILWHNTVLKNKRGEITGLLSSGEDITDRKNKEIELKKLSTAVTQSPSVIAITDTRGKLEYVNPKFTEITGYTFKETKGKNPKILKSEDQSDLIFKELWKTISSGKIWRGEFRNKKKSGEIFWEAASISPILDKQGKIINYIKVAEDISKHKQAELTQKVMFNISETLNTTTSMLDFMTNIRSLLGVVINTENFYIALYDEKRDMLSLPFNIDEKDDFTEFPAGKSITKYVINTGKPLLATQEIVEELIQKGLVENVGTASQIYLGVPLKIENRVIGVIAVQSYDDPNLYTEKDIKLLSFVSIEIALAITKKSAEEQILKDLEEKKTLLQELHHRTKNNMQVISSLLRMQSLNITDDYILSTFKELNNKIQAMSLVHRKLYQSKDLSKIDLKEYIEDLTALLIDSFGLQDGRISFQLDLQVVPVLMDSAVPLGLIINELISNAFKHAFPEDNKGEILIKLYIDEDSSINIHLADNGIGIPVDLNLRKSTSMGLRTMYSLIEYQLKGEANYFNDNGLRWHLKMKDNLHKVRV